MSESEKLWYRMMSWALPLQQQPNAQGNYAASAYSIGGATLVAKKAAPVASSLRMPEPGDKIRHRLAGYVAVITDVIYDCVDDSAEPNKDMPGVPRVRVLVKNERNSYLIDDYVWSSLDHFHEAMEVLSTGHAYTPRLSTKAAAPIDRKKFPHDCKLCGSPCWNGFTHVECSNVSCSANRGFVR